MLTEDKSAAPKSVIESEPTPTTTLPLTMAGVYSSSKIFSVSVEWKPSTESLPSPEEYSITFSFVSEPKLIKSLPVLPAIVLNEPPLKIVSLSAPPEMETFKPVLSIESAESVP